MNERRTMGETKGHLKCLMCKRTKPIEDFKPRSTKARGSWHSWCIQCKRAYDCFALERKRSKATKGRRAA